MAHKGTLVDLTQYDPVHLESQSMFRANLNHAAISQASRYKNTLYLVMWLLTVI